MLDAIICGAAIGGVVTIVVVLVSSALLGV